MSSRSWVYTINNYSEKDIIQLRSFTVRKHRSCAEVGASETPHLQGAITFIRNYRLPQLKKLMPNAHWEIAFAKDAENYCTKGDIIIDTNDSQQGKRSDIDEVLTLVKEGKTNEEIAQEHPKLIFKFSKNIQSLRLALQPRTKLWKQIKVIIYVGKPGTGKSRKVFEQSDNLYNVMEPINGNIWFDNYTGQEDILLDDFYGWIKYHTLLQLLDGYPMQLPIKGSTVWKNWSRVFITSNKDPSEWYNRPEWDALRRRITTIEHI